MEDTTIYALGTPPPSRAHPGALSVIRLSGPRAADALIFLTERKAFERGTMQASVDFSAFNIAAIATRAALRHLAGESVPPEIMVPAELIDRSNCQRWKVPFGQRPSPAWDEIVR